MTFQLFVKHIMKLLLHDCSWLSACEKGETGLGRRRVRRENKSDKRKKRSQQRGEQESCPKGGTQEAVGTKASVQVLAP